MTPSNRSSASSSTPGTRADARRRGVPGARAPRATATSSPRSSRPGWRSRRRPTTTSRRAQRSASEPALRAALDAAAIARRRCRRGCRRCASAPALRCATSHSGSSPIFGIDDEQRAADYLERIERDELDASRLSRRLLDALAAILGADRDQLVPRALIAAPTPAPAPAPALASSPAAGARSRPGASASARAFFRSAAEPRAWVEDDIDALSRAALAPAPPTRRPDAGTVCARHATAGRAAAARCAGRAGRAAAARRATARRGRVAGGLAATTRRRARPAVPRRPGNDA